MLSSPDMAYGAAEIVGWMVNDKEIEPHVLVWDKTQRADETLSSSEFQWDNQADQYRCPQGRVLRRQWRPFKQPRTHITNADTIIYRSSQSDCADCPMKIRCCPNTPIRKIARSVYEPARDVARAIAKTAVYKQSRKDRKKVEMLFAHLKRIMKLDRLRLRGLSGVATRQPTNITAQELGAALQTLATERNVQFVYRSEVVGEHRTGRATGNLTFDEAQPKSACSRKRCCTGCVLRAT
jgi:hypothetical protein